jgi:hypothetical protein
VVETIARFSDELIIVKPRQRRRCGATPQIKYVLILCRCETEIRILIKDFEDCGFVRAWTSIDCVIPDRISDDRRT